MKTLTWFTHTNIDTRKVASSSVGIRENDSPKLSFDLTKFLFVFKENEIWNKKKYRSEYNDDFEKTDFEKITSIKINLHSEDAPYSNLHNYENLLKGYINLNDYEISKISSSGISDASQIAVVIVEFTSENKVIDYLSYDEEKDIDTVFEKRLSEANHESWKELNKIKSVVCEFIQFFFSFNLHLSFLSHSYEFSFTNKPNLIGFTTVTEGDKFYYETDKIDFFAHYILYQKEHDQLSISMAETSKFWHKDIPSIHFFLDALKGNHITATNFIKLVFTVESFFGERASNDFITLTVPLLLDKDITGMKSTREILRKAFDLRNKIVHGNEIYDLRETLAKKQDSKKISNLFFELKNVLIKLFCFYINENLYNTQNNEKINHELIFRLLPKGISK